MISIDILNSGKTQFPTRYEHNILISCMSLIALYWFKYLTLHEIELPYIMCLVKLFNLYAKGVFWLPQATTINRRK